MTDMLGRRLAKIAPDGMFKPPKQDKEEMEVDALKGCNRKLELKASRDLSEPKGLAISVVQHSVPCGFNAPPKVAEGKAISCCETRLILQLSQMSFNELAGVPSYHVLLFVAGLKHLASEDDGQHATSIVEP